MKILKFGGTSVGKPERMRSVAQLIASPDKKLVVLSAVSGTTNSLVNISDLLTKKDIEGGKKAIDNLFDPYDQFVESLYSTAEGKATGREIIANHKVSVSSFLTEKEFGDKHARAMLAEGELISTELFHSYLVEQGHKAVLLPALDFMRIDADDEPMLAYTEEKLTAIVAAHKDAHILITQGFICLNPLNEIDNLKRGGSDYTASLIGAALRADEIQIWTDIDGMHNNDPRIVKRTYPINELTFDEAAELAYFGAKILHPSTILPAQKYGIPVKLLNTMQPEAKGTVIANKTTEKDIKAIAAKDNITVIKIKSSRMLLAYGFLHSVFAVFEKYKTSIDMITTSEVAVSLTIDNPKHIDAITKELKEFCTVETENNQTIICIVGQFVQENNQIVRKVMDALADTPVRMISFGGSKNNISVLMKTEYKNAALEELNERLFFAELV